MEEQHKIEEIEKIHKEYEKKLADLKLEKENLLEAYLNELEDIRIQEIRNNLK